MDARFQKMCGMGLMLAISNPTQNDNEHWVMATADLFCILAFLYYFTRVWFQK